MRSATQCRVKFDVNDTRFAPMGYIIRTNYSFAGQSDEGYGYIRYLTAEQMFFQASAEHDLSLEFILRKATRNFSNSLSGIDLLEPPFPLSSAHSEFICMQDYITRASSVSSMIVQGVKPGESADLTTIWTILGLPSVSVVIPTWVSGGETLPSVLRAAPGRNAPLCDKALALKKRCFPITRGSGQKYLDRALLINQQGDGILQQILAIEQQVLEYIAPKLADWRANGLNKSEIQKTYHWFDSFISENYKNRFGL